MVTSKEVTAQLGIPHTTLYRLVKQGHVPTHQAPRQSWHQRAPAHKFYLSEVRAALERLQAERRPQS